MIGDILKLIRIANDNMSIKDVSEKCGINSNYISEMENGVKEPSLKMLKKVTSFYNIPLSKVILFDELKTQNNLNYQQTLIMILEHYTSKENKCHNNKIKIK